MRLLALVLAASALAAAVAGLKVAPRRYIAEHNPWNEYNAKRGLYRDPSDNQFGPIADDARNTTVDLAAMQRCFRPRVFVTGGLPRSGSTSLSLAVKIWLTLADPNFVPSRRCPWWGTPEIGSHKDDLKKARKTGQKKSFVIKVHKPEPWVMDVADVVLMSHRQPVDQLASLKLSGGMRGDYISSCTGIMRQQEEMFNASRVCCGQVAYDVPVEKLRANPAAELRNIALAMGICKEGLSREVVDWAAKLFQEHLPVDEGRGLVTPQQLWHEEGQRSELKPQILQSLHSTVKVEDKNPKSAFEAKLAKACLAWEKRDGRYGQVDPSIFHGGKF